MLVATGVGCGVIMCNCVNVPMSQQYRGHSSPPLGPGTRDRGGGRDTIEDEERDLSVKFLISLPLSCVR